MNSNDDDQKLIQLHKEKYLGYDVYLEYLLKRLGSRYEEFKARQEIQKHHGSVTLCELLRDFR